MLLKHKFAVVLPSFISLLHMAAAGTVLPSANAAHNVFATNLFRTIAPENLHKNVVYSPASIQSCLTLAFMGAEGKTADEMRSGLSLGVESKQNIAQNYAEFIKDSFKTSQKGGPILKMANSIFVSNLLKISPEFSKIAEIDFDSNVKQLNFGDATNAVKEINSWVEQKTENKIQNLLQSDAVDGETSSILVNAIYFKGLWLKQFSTHSTQKAPFYLDDKQQVEVDMMYNDDRYNYAVLPDLDAVALEMPYAHSELSMMIILPNKRNGLAKLENKLANIDLNEIASKMESHDVEVFLPKFKFEFDMDLKPALKKLGMKSMFDSTANFGALFETKDTRPMISEVRHKAYLDVNEAGSEAAAATYLKIVPMSLNLQQKIFNANHPFVFAIRDSRAVYFAGHVSQF